MGIPPVLFVLMLGLWAARANSIDSIPSKGTKKLANVNIECNSNNIMVTISTDEDFNGMIYPRGLSKNSSCLSEYDHVGSKVTYVLPLRSCNTMSHEVKEGVEYFNTVVVQPHHKLVTNSGKGLNVRCRYQKQRNTTFDTKAIVDPGSVSPLHPSISLPNCVMKIFIGRPDGHVVAEHVKIGDYLTLLIKIDEQDIFGMKITNCIVKDGLSWSEQPLINNEGCPIEEEIMGTFEYSNKLTSAQVTFPAHKFPYTNSVYYQCNVKLCYKQDGSCDDSPPICDATGSNVRRRRRKRQSDVPQGNLRSLQQRDEDEKDRSVEVFSGLYVNEVDEADDSDSSLLLTPTAQDDEFCVSTRKFAIGIAIAGVLLTVAVILLVVCIVNRRRRKKTFSGTDSSIYSGPYSNHAYSRD